MNVTAYCQKIHELFEAHQDVENAQGQKAYMKGKFEYYGLKAGLRKELTQSFIKANGMPQKEELADFAHQMWAMPHRELQYACIDILIKWKRKVGPEMLHLYQFMTENKSWWDTVDMIASHLVGEVVKNNPDLKFVMDVWSESENMWIKRVAILHQLKYKDKTDSERLFSYCEKNIYDQEFFIRKAIGWALREYSKRNEAAVREFVADHPDLSGLSQREALKWLNARSS